MRFLGRSLTGLFLLSLTLGLLVWSGQTLREAVQARMDEQPRAVRGEERVFAVTLRRARARSATPQLKLYGEVHSRRTLEVRAAVGGRIVELADNFREGGNVRAGQVLARVDPADLRDARDRAENDLADARTEQREATAALELAREDLQSARAQADLQERALARQKDLRARGAGTSSAVEGAELTLGTAKQAILNRRQAVMQAEARVERAAAQLSRARLALAEAERRLSDSVIRAEFDGTLSDVVLVRGGLVSAGERLADLIDGDALEVAFRMSTTQYARLLDDRDRLRSLEVRVRLVTNDAALEASGLLDRDSAAVADGQTGRLVFARLDDARGLKPGDFVAVEVKEPPLPDVVRLPATAINTEEEVLVLGDDDRLESVSVTLLRRQGDDVLLQATPALVGRDVVVRRSPLLGAGIKVRPLRGDGAALPAGDETGTLRLSDERRARLIAQVRDDRDLARDEKERLVKQLQAPDVPAATVRHIEARAGG